MSQSNDALINQWSEKVASLIGGAASSLVEQLYKRIGQNITSPRLYCRVPFTEGYPLAPIGLLPLLPTVIPGHRKLVIGITGGKRQRVEVLGNITLLAVLSGASDVVTAMDGISYTESGERVEISVLDAMANPQSLNGFNYGLILDHQAGPTTILDLPVQKFAGLTTPICLVSFVPATPQRKSTLESCGFVSA